MRTFACTRVKDVSAPARDGKLVLEMTSKRKKQKKRQIFDPSLGVTQFPRAWSEASTIASNRKRAKELKEVNEYAPLVNTLHRL